MRGIDHQNVPTGTSDGRIARICVLSAVPRSASLVKPGRLTVKTKAVCDYHFPELLDLLFRSDYAILHTSSP